MITASTSGAVLALFFYDGIVQGIFLADDNSFGLEVLSDIVAWREEFYPEKQK